MQKVPVAPAKIDEDAVYALTAKGKAELNAAGTSLSAVELELLVLLDGTSTVAQVMKRAPSHSPTAVVDALDRLSRDGLVAADVKSDEIEATGFFTRPVFPEPASATAEAASQSDVTLELLRRQGYVARIAKRASKPRKLAADEKINILVIEDDPQLAKLLRMFLQMEGFVLGFAANRDEITAALRLGKPDLVLLDVTLPDVDGFDVLSRMRQHPVLQAVPVIMMTGQATRGAVLKGLARGADGYITKPFDVEVIAKAVKSVLGLR